MRLERSMLAPALNQFPQVGAGIHDVFPNGVRRSVRVSRPAHIKKLAVSLARQVQVTSHDQMESRVPVALHVQGL